VRSALALTAAAALAAGLLLAVRPGGAHEAGAVHATISPVAPLFGDLVVARVEVPRGARVAASFAPFEVVRTERTPRAWTFTLRCVAVACLTRGRAEPLQLPPARVVSGGRTALVRWPILSLGSRLTPLDVGRPRFRIDTDPHAPRYRVAPAVLGWTLAGLAAALVAGAGAWIALLLRRRRPVLQVVEPDASTPLERALARLEQALGQPVARRRIALDELALELSLLGADPLAQRARRLGWSPASPKRHEIERLLDDCRQVAA
jgi:hypothetical protein